MVETWEMFKVCKSVHYHTIQINHQLDAAVSSVFYLTFVYSSTRFGHTHARNVLSCKYTSSKILEKLLHLVGDLFESN
jgi:hypothetical protein